MVGEWMGSEDMHTTTETTQGEVRKFSVHAPITCLIATSSVVPFPLRSVFFHAPFPLLVCPIIVFISTLRSPL